MKGIKSEEKMELWGRYSYFTFKRYSERLAKPGAKNKGKAWLMLF